MKRGRRAQNEALRCDRLVQFCCKKDMRALVRTFFAGEMRRDEAMVVLLLLMTGSLGPLPDWRALLRYAGGCTHASLSCRRGHSTVVIRRDPL